MQQSIQAEELKERVVHWRRRLDEAGEGVEICAATKMQTPQTINNLYDLGITCIGENRVQELVQKFDRLNPAYRIELIGHLQTNKVKYMQGRVDRVQSLDSLPLAQALSERFARADESIGVLIQVNIAEEAQKYGVREEELQELAAQVSRLPGLRLEGLMAIMPISTDPQELRPLFRRMRAWFDRLRQESFAGPAFQTLSMGMSGDCIVAAQEGATMVRLGTALFGARVYAH